MTGHEKIAARNIKGAFNWIVGGYYNCIQDEEPEALPKSRQELFDEIYSSAFTDKYVCGGCMGKAPDEMRFAGTEFCTDYLNKLLDTDSDVTEIAEVAGWNKKEEKENTMKRFESKRNPGTFIELLKENDKCKTVTVKFEDGKIKDLSSATLKRWYTEVEESSTLQNEEPVKESTVEEKPVEVVTTEPEVEDKPKEQTVNSIAIVSELSNFISDTFDIDVHVLASSPRDIYIKKNGKGVVDVYAGKKQIKVLTRNTDTPTLITDLEVVKGVSGYKYAVLLDSSKDIKTQLTSILNKLGIVEK